MSESIRASGISGVIFAITFTAAGILLADLLGSFGDSDETFVEYYSSFSSRAGSAFGGVLLLAGGIAILPFIAGLFRLVDPQRTSWAAVQLALPLSYIASGLILAAAAALSTVGFARVFAADIFDESSPHLQGSGVAVLPQFGYVLIVFAGWVLAMLLAIVAVVSMRNRSLPRGLGWLTIVCAGLLVISPTVAPLWAIPLWALATSVVMLRQSRVA
jgi:hypothetical protein